MLDVFIDALLDSLKVLAVAFVIYFILSFIETNVSKVLEKNKKVSPLIGSALGLIPQCGMSVVSSDLYLKHHITMGTLVAVFIACSDEALPIMLSNPNKIIMVLPLILIKFVLGFVTGFIVDLFATKKDDETEKHLETCEGETDIHVGCCNHEIDDQKESKWHKHLVHPLIHSLKIFAYVFVINMIFGMLIYYVGKDNIASFINQNKYWSPLFTCLVGLIPNCASSVIITNMYLLDEISFGATLSGLIVNAGLGIMVLLKNKNAIKDTLIIIGILLFVGLLAGYGFCLIFGF